MAHANNPSEGTTSASIVQACGNYRERKNMTERTRVARPEESIVDPDERTEDQLLKPLRCQAGSKTDDGGCPRPATTWMHPEDRDYALCDEHARLQECADEASNWSIVEEITRDWQRVAESWRLADLEQLATNAHDTARLEYLKAHAKVELAEEIAEAPRRQDARVPAQLKREEEEELRRHIRRTDELTNALTTIERIPEGEMDEDVRDRTLAVLVEEQERAHRGYEEYRRELGLKEITD